MNPSGQTVSGGGFLLTGSVGGVDTQVASGGAFQVTPGLQKIYFYPNTVADVTPSPASNAQLDITWSAPAAEVLLNKPAVSYLIKYSSATPLTDQFAFAAAPTAAQSLTPQTPGSLESLSIPGLLANTSYYIAVESLDQDKSGSYFSTFAATYTLCNTPDLLTSDQWGFTANSITPVWNTQNQDPRDTILFEIQNSTDLFSSFNVDNQVASASLGLASSKFQPLSQGVDYSFRVRAFNGAGVPTSWSVAVTTRIPVGLPIDEPFTGQAVDKFVANWLPNGGIPPGWPNPVTDPSFQVTMADNAAFNNPTLQPIPAGQVLSSTFTSGGGLTLAPNTTYYAKVRAFPVGGGNPSAFTDLGLTMTGVWATVAGTYTPFVSSATFTWSAPPTSNGANGFYYRVEMSTAADYSGVLSSTTVSSPQLTASVTGLVANTVYYARVVTLNGIMIPSVDPGPLDLGFKTTQAIVPLPTGFTFVDDHQIEMSWSPNGNNPLQTHYQVDVSSDSSGNFGFLSASTLTARGAILQRFNAPLQLLANTTYFARIKAVADAGGTDSAYAAFGSTVTRPTSATAPFFTAMAPTGMTVNWSNVNGPAQNGNDTVYRTDVRAVAAGPVVQTQSGTPLNAAFSGLSVNTTYYLSVTALARSTAWPDAASVSAATATLTNVPATAATPFSGVTDSTAAYAWTANGNPSDTDYRVEDSTDNFASVTLSLFMTAPGALTRTFTGLLANTSYWFRVTAVNRDGVPSAFLTQGPVVTLARPVSITGFDTASTTISVHVGNNGNGAGTEFDLLRDGVTLLTFASSAGVESILPDSGLLVNSSHTYQARSVARDGSLGPWSLPVMSTWTLAAPDSVLNVGANQPKTLDLDLIPNSNPTGVPAFRANTQFAIQLESVSPDGFPTMTGLYMGASIGINGFGRGIHLATSTVPVWQNLAQWDGGVIVSSGLATGRQYGFRLLARNGDNGVGPDIVTLCGISFGRTKSDTPIIYLNGIDAFQSENTPTPANFVWTNTLKIPFIALGAFNNNIQIKDCRTDFNCNNPGITPGNHINPGAPGPFVGWNGRYDPAAPLHDAVPPPPPPATGIWDNTGSFSGIHVTEEGRWYVHIVGDSYNFIAAAQDGTLGHFTDDFPGPSYQIFVDTTPPVAAALNLRAQRSATRPTAIISGKSTGWITPYFLWDDPDAGSPGIDFTISPTVGYSWSFSLDPSAASDPVMSSDTFVNPNFLAGVNNRAVQMPVQGAETAYFKVRSLDKAGNWSAPMVFQYICVPDLVEPIVFVDLGPSALIPGNGVSVAVSTTGIINIYFDKEMDGATVNNANIRLRALDDNLGRPLPLGATPPTGVNVPLGVAFFSTAGVASSTATLTPAGGLQPGFRYELDTTAGLQDLSGNSLATQVAKRFYTLMDPTQRNVVLSEALDASGNAESQITFNTMSWGASLAGLAINDTPATQPMAAPSLAGMIVKANKNLDHVFHGYGKPLAVQEFNLYNPLGLRIAGLFNEPVTLTMHYNDSSPADGIVDGTESTGAPVKVSALAIYWLDDDTGVWVRLPGSVVDTVNHTVTAEVRHFSVYGLLGAPTTDLTLAHAYPVPYKPSIHTNGIRFTNVSDVVTIKVYTVNGELVKTLHSESTGGVVVWNPVTNDSGEPLASDVYIYLMENDQQKKTGKLIVVR